MIVIFGIKFGEHDIFFLTPDILLFIPHRYLTETNKLGPKSLWPMLYLTETSERTYVHSHNSMN